MDETDEDRLRHLIIDAVRDGYAAAARQHGAQRAAAKAVGKREALESVVIATAKMWAFRMSFPAIPMNSTEETALYQAVANLRAHEEDTLFGRLGGGVMGGQPADAIADTERLHDDE